MRSSRLCIAASIMVMTSVLAVAQQGSVPPAAPALVMGMTLSSTAFDDGALIPEKYTQAVPTPVSPPLAWSYVPGGVQSFVLICEDLDAAPNKSPVGTLHWLVFNIPAESRSLAEGIPAVALLSDGPVQVLNEGRVVGWRGPGARWPGSSVSR